ncbi:hypothetical protein MtrunA17_Chr8g0335171 [Medicago truncatula]|uniref:Uncharacterized protein n=1 Tax=Medicago truncatula TaxID=3880 RepID=I3SSB1_MEDTR|nr:unknown [Medicago truncatula]RHN38620.1 hypothetical protein MtrunA17_Chr8g0335171 [Medicago truncatula]
MEINSGKISLLYKMEHDWLIIITVMKIAYLYKSLILTSRKLTVNMYKTKMYTHAVQKLCNFNAKEESAFLDEPCSLVATAAPSLNSLILFCISKLSSPSMILFTHLATSSLFTIPLSSSTFGLTATLSTSVNNLAFILCSANRGHAITGTPLTTVSKVEPQPQ